MQLATEKTRKVRAQKGASYYRQSRNKVTSGQKQDEDFDRVMEQLDHQCLRVKELQQELDTLLEEKQRAWCIDTKPDGTFTDELRFCIMQLAGLEVAAAKITPVIDVVAKTLFGCTLSLPNATTSQAVIDEGHYIAQRYIAKRLDEADHWGINKDGTMRRKRKLLDTTVTLDSGEIMSLGFTRVLSETSENIAETTKEHLTELGSAASHESHEQDKTQDDFVRDSLAKLSFYMSDRAANEAKADRLLTDWRDSVLDHGDNTTEPGAVHSFKCMAHVLLGFHNYSAKSLKAQEKDITETSGKFGRSALPVFKFWKQAASAAERTVRMAAEVFGPVGDHHGVRDRWEAHCSTAGIKSHMSNYRDNRFNALFRSSAEVLHHHQDLLTVLNTVQTPNLKLKSVKADLECSTVMSILQALAIMYLKVTDPYWTLVLSDVKYLELYRYIQVLHEFLGTASQNPEVLLQLDVVMWPDIDLSPSAKVPSHQSVPSTPRTQVPGAGHTEAGYQCHDRDC